MKALLLDALRHLDSRRRATAVAVSGLMAAQAACLLVLLFAIALATPDPGIPDPDRVVLLDFKGNPPGEPSPWFTATPVAFGELLKARHAPMDAISRTVVGGIEFVANGRSNPAYVLAADPDIVDLLGLRALAGDLRATLERRDAIALSRELLEKVWGTLPPAQAIGRRLEAAGRWYTVTAIIPDADPRSPIWDATPLVGHSMVLVNIDSPANAMSAEDRQKIFLMTGRVFARLRPGTSVDQVGGWMHDAFVSSPQYAGLPVAWHTGRQAAYFRGVTMRQLPFEGPANELRWQLMGGVAAAAVLLLVLAAFNTMNLHAAGLLQRQRETALRRSLGASGHQLVQLWALETIVPLLVSACGALLLAWWCAPAVANWMGLPPEQPVADPLPLRAVAALAASVAVLLPLTLAWPAWSELRRTPATALQGRTASEGPWGRRVRQGLLGLQLGGALLLLALSGVLALQQRYLLGVDRGFDTRDRLVLSMETNPETVPNLDVFTTALAQSPAVAHWAFSMERPAADTMGQRESFATTDGRELIARSGDVSSGFFATYGMTLLAGEPRVAAGEDAVVIDAKAAKGLGYPSPQAAVGALLRDFGDTPSPGARALRVVAVVKDVTMESARGVVLPQCFHITDRPMWNVTATGPDRVALRAAMEAAWKAHGLLAPYQFQWADDQRADVYRQEAQLTTTLTAVSLLAVAVAMLGAYAMVADTLRRRRTELVLHRLHGASDAAIARQVAGEFGVPLVAAALVALPLAAWLGAAWLSGFRDHISLPAGLAPPILAAAIATLLVTALASLRHVRQALALQPIEALG